MFTFHPDHIANAHHWRHLLHQHPEVSGRETATARRIAEWLAPLHPDTLMQNLGGTGITACFDSGQPGPSILLRTELDALPIQETNDLPYRSRTDGVSHKCGHDGHMAILLLVAQYLSENRPQQGKVTLLFQPAEEDGSGAVAVLNDPGFDVTAYDIAFALHNLPDYQLGKVVYREGPFTAAVKSLIIRLHGKTAHAAEPENGQNPALAIAELLQTADQLQEPDIHNEDFALLTPVYLTMGEKAYGVSAGYGEVHLTLRAWRQAHMEAISEQFLEATRSICQKYGLTCDHDWTDAFQTNRNHPEAIALLEEAIKNQDMEGHVRAVPLKWGEDFGAFLQQIDGAMFGLGAGEDQPALHNPDYDFPDVLIEKGARLFVELCRLKGVWG
jgi:amidohydrolase